MIQTQTARTADPHELPDMLRFPIETARAEADALRRLPSDLVETLRQSGAFRLTTPLELGGFELSLSDTVSLYERFGRVDGPVAWNIWNGNMGFTAALLAEEGVAAVWATPDPIIANAAQPSGVASPAPGGYRLSGRWGIVSAIDIADWVVLFAIAMDDTPEVRALFLPRADIEVVDTWHTAGMRGTGSQTVVVEDAFVPAHLAVSPFAAGRIDRPLYRIPAFTIASTGAAPIVVGIAQAALDEIVSMAPTKGTDNGQPLAERPHAHSRLGAAQTSLDAARALLQKAAADIDAAATRGADVNELLRARMRAAMSHSADVARDVLLACQQLASSTAVYSDTPIERLIRDGNVAAQHYILSSTHLDILGRLMVGVEAGTPII